jgi:iron(III) transport system substrate-binding protein
MKKLLTLFYVLSLWILFPPSLGRAQSLYEAAKKEGKVIIYGWGDDAFQRIAKAFMQTHRGIEVQGQDMRGQEAREKIIAEQGAGRVIADLVSGGENSIAELRQMGFLEKYESPELKFIRKEILDPLGFRNPYRVNVYGITINTNLIPATDEPKRWADLLHPRFHGKIAAQDPRGSGGGLYIMTALSRLYGLDFIRKLAKQNIFFGNRSAQLVTDLVRGERGVIMTASWQDQTLQKSLKRKAPLKFTKPEEGVMIIPISLALVKNGPHPNAAKLFIDWLLRPEGQRVGADVHYTPGRVGVPALEPEANIEGVKILPLEDWTTKPELVAEMTKHWEEIFFKK